MIRLNQNNQVEEYTFILARRDHSHIGQITNVQDVNYINNLNGADEISFSVPKLDERDLRSLSEDERIQVTSIWNSIVDFKYVYIKEINKYFEIAVTIEDEEYITKTVVGTEACEAELGQSLLFGLEINTEADIKRAEYKTPTKFYMKNDPENSLLNRVLYKLPQYSIKYVDASLCNIQREFSADDTDVYSFLTETVAEEVGCLFTFDSTDRTISAYDLKDVCLDCGHRGDFGDVCPKCNGHNIQHYGTDTTILVDTENLAESITFETDVDSVKNCFKLKAGDENMTAAIRNRNPNGSDYIYYFSNEQKAEMPPALVEKIEAYDNLVKQYDPEYAVLIENVYEYIDKIAYYTNEMMPKREDTPTDAKKEAAKLTVANLSPLGLSKLTASTSTATVNSALNEYVRTIVKTGWFTAKVKNGRFVHVGKDPQGLEFGSWQGNFEVVNNSDDEDIAESAMIEIRVDNNYEVFLEQKIKKHLQLKDEDGSIFDVLALEDLVQFKEALKLYGLTRLTSFMDSIQGCIDIMIEADQAKENRELYNKLYVPYLDKLNAVQDEIDVRKKTIDDYKEKLSTTQKRQREIQRLLNFEKYLGAEMYKTFCCYKREQTYSNDNYISTDLDNKKIFENAGAFIEAAQTELYKSGNHQHMISGNLLNLLAMPEFKLIRDNFEVGNFIRIKVNGKVYKLRLTQISVDFTGIQNIDVEFSDVTKVRYGFTDTKSILEKAKSMSTTYSSVTHQVKNSKEQTDMMKDFVNNGLTTTAMKIVNNADKQDIVFNESGLTARRKEDFNNKYEPYQVKMLNSGVYTTSNGWRTVDNAIGKYYYNDPETGEQKIGFGVLAESLVGNLILGKNLIINSEDQSASMKFDNFGLVLNAKDNGTGQYKRIFDIQKDGKSQLYMDTEGNIVLANKQMIQITDKVDKIVGDIANFDKLYVTDATIKNLLAQYAKIEYLEANFATIKNLTATNAQIENLKANDVTITGQLTANSATIEQLKAFNADIENLYAKKAEIDSLIANNATINGKLNANAADIKDLKAFNATIDNLYAKKAEVEDLKAENVTINGQLTANSAAIKSLQSDKISTGELNAYKATIEKIIAGYATIKQLEAESAKIKQLQADKADIGELNVLQGNFDNLKVKVAEIDSAVINKADIKDLNAVNATIGTLQADLIKANELIAKKIEVEQLNAEIAKVNKLIADEIIAVNATITNLDAKFATIEQLKAQKAELETLIAKKATIEELNATNAKIGKLDALVGNIDSLLAGNAGVGTLQAIHLTAQNVNIDKAVIQDMIAANISVADLQAGKISTNKFEIGSDEGNLAIKDNTIQISDAVRPRVQIGKDAGNDYNMYVWDDKGQLMFDALGVTDKGIQRPIIRDDVVANDANISGSKLNINSVVDKINEDGTRSINSNKIWINEENQSLGASFTQINKKIDNIGTPQAYRVEIESTAGFNFKNGNGQSVAMCHLFHNNQEIDNLKTNMIVKEFPVSPKELDYCYKIDVNQKDVILYQYVNGVWESIPFPYDYTYMWYRYDKMGVCLDTNAPYKTGKLIYVDSSMVDCQMTFKVQVDDTPELVGTFLEVDKKLFATEKEELLDIE